MSETVQSNVTPAAPAGGQPVTPPAQVVPPVVQPQDLANSQTQQQPLNNNMLQPLQPQEPQSQSQPTGVQEADAFDELVNPDQAESSPQMPEIPENYDFNGVQVKDTTYLTQDQELVTSIGKEIGLTNDQARKLLERGSDAIANNQIARAKELSNRWLSEVKADPVVGGANLQTTKTNLGRVFSKYGQTGKEAYNFLKTSGLGTNPALVKLFNAIGKDLSAETHFVQGTPTTTPKRNQLRSRYNNSPDLIYEDE